MHKELVYMKGFAKGKGYWEMLKAIQIAIELHDGQKRKMGGDYIEHPMSVASELMALGLHDEELLTSAILHDVIEDCNVSNNDLVENYGIKRSTVFIVSLLSKDLTTTNYDYYKCIEKSSKAILVKVADRCHNISTMIGAFTISKMTKYVEETERYILPLCKYGINHYPEHSDELFVMRNHIQSVISCIKMFIEVSMKERCEK